MSVLIAGMAMPENCDVCFMRDSCEYSMPVGKLLFECPLTKVPIGKWIWDDEGFHCSECFYHAYGCTGEIISNEWHFCPNCGADMREES